MTIAGRPVESGVVVFWGQVVQRLAVIGLIAAILHQHPDSDPAWLALGAVVADLFHQARTTNGNGNGYGHGTAK